MSEWGQTISNHRWLSTTMARPLQRISFLAITIIASPECTVNSLSLIGILDYARNLLAPSSTTHLANLFEAYDILQKQPASSSSSQEEGSKQLLFQDIASDVTVTTKEVVAGTGLVANRRFDAGEVVALYPIHALGYAHGREPPAVVRCQQSSLPDSIVGTSDLVCFQDEARYFGVATEGATADDEVDYSYTMLDPSGRYVFDANPSQPIVNAIFVAHFVNDAACAYFINGCDGGGMTAVKEQALNYLEASLSNFNCVMTPFGPPPLVAYVTVKPVDAGSEFLASYGLDYWIGKVDDDEAHMIYQHMEKCPLTKQRMKQYDDEIAIALEKAKVCSSERYARHTKLLLKMIGEHMSNQKSNPTVNNPSRRRHQWRHRICGRLKDKLKRRESL